MATEAEPVTPTAQISSKCKNCGWLIKRGDYGLWYHPSTEVTWCPDEQQEES
jgi:hypothetical protein